ncbi:Hypothetical predicted protein [Mytilus galloprovincialis]|uniref:ShKT domain-containing protein n=1 Tax=Mytilus galloprovincialis TaxID=29158 RepID=A0A8B6DRL8_MYTGA|nr:Hypothetical predicted protein [Mytilus galloprovincialis]
MLQGSYVVNSLLDSCNFFYKYYHVVTDSFFTSIDLAKELLRKGTFMTGTLRKNRAMPSSIKNPTINDNEAKFLRQGQLLLCVYKETRRRKPVRLLSTACTAELNNSGKPKLIEHYNTKMGGVDLADQLVSANVDDRKTMKLWEKVVSNLLQRMVTNAYILYNQNSDAPRLSRLSFLQSIIEDLAQEHLLSCQQRLPNREPNNALIRLTGCSYYTGGMYVGSSGTGTMTGTMTGIGTGGSYYTGRYVGSSGSGTMTETGGSGTTTVACVDKQGKCTDYAREGTCTDPRYTGWVKDNCARTCLCCEYVKQEQVEK